MRDGTTKRVWLHLLEQGGHHTPEEVSRALLEADSRKVGTILSSLATGGSVKRFARPGHVHSTYGVTLDCKVPFGVLMSEIAEVLQ